MRNVDWPEDIQPKDVTAAEICDRDDQLQNGCFEFRTGTQPYNRCPIPMLHGAANKMEIDLAFAQVDTSSSSENTPARFFMPIVTEDDNGETVHALTEARKVTFGTKEFLHFVGVRRS